MRTAFIHIGEREAGGYPLRLEAEDDRDPATDVMAAEDLDVPSLRSVLVDATAPTARLAEIGRTLYDSLFRGQVGERWRALVSAPPLRTLLEVADPELRKLPWELMRDTNWRLATRRELPICRYAPRAPDADGGTTPWPMRILVVAGIPRTSGGSTLHDTAMQELRELPDALQAMLGLIDLEVLRLPSEEVVRNAIKTMRPHVLHVIAHGVANGAGLRIAHESGRNWDWTVEDIADDLFDQRPYLVVLNACRSAAEQEATWNVADAFLNHGVRAVIGMQGDIAGDAAAAFSAGLYGEVADGQPVDVAVAVARRKVIDGSSDRHRDWALASLVTSVPPERVLPRPILSTLARHAQRPDLCCFVGHGWPRRHVLHQLALGPGLGSAEVAVVSLFAPKTSPPPIGKTWFLRWCIRASALNGRNAAYVDLREIGALSFVGVLGSIARELADNDPPDGRNSAAFDAWREEIDGLPGAWRKPVPGQEQHAYHRELNLDHPPEQFAQKILAAFTGALVAAAGEEGLVLALDHVGERTVERGHWNKYLVPHLLRPLAAHEDKPVRLIIDADDEYVVELSGLVRGVDREELKPFPPARREDLTRLYLLHRFERQGVDTYMPMLAELVKAAQGGWTLRKLQAVEELLDGLVARR